MKKSLIILSALALIACKKKDVKPTEEPTPPVVQVPIVHYKAAFILKKKQSSFNDTLIVKLNDSLCFNLAESEVQDVFLDCKTGDKLTFRYTAGKVIEMNQVKYTENRLIVYFNNENGVVVKDINYMNCLCIANYNEIIK